MITSDTRDGIAVVTFDQPEAKLNVLSPAFLQKLQAELDLLRAEKGVRGVVLASAKRDCFLAGADLKAMRELQTGPDPRAQGAAVSRDGQSFMNQLEDWPVPVVAAVGGICLGGGTELALACRYRVASDADSTRIATPEVKLGILPGWGGTWRMPRLIGVPAALDLMLTGREVSSRAALKCGLVDEVAPAAALAESARLWLLRILAKGDGAIRARRRAARPRLTRWLVDSNPLGRMTACAMARRTVMRETHGAYPAPLRITRVVAGHGMGSRDAGLRREAAALGDLLATPVARNLLGVFFLTQEGKATGPKATARPVARVGLVGGGLMGSGIATVFANRSIPVRLKDISTAEVGKALRNVADHFRGQARRRRLTPLLARDRSDSVSGGTTYEGLGTADLIVEAVPEKLELKRSVFQELERVVRPDAVLASNTSTLPIGSIAADLRHPERAIGMHFFFPAPRMPLVEVIPSAMTSPEVTATVVELARRCGKTAIVVKDSPGFLVNRILLPYMIEAYFLLQEGATVAAVDGAAEAFGMPMGPVRLTGEVGVKVAFSAGAVILEAFRDRLERPRLLDAMGKTEGLFAIKGRSKLPNAGVIETLARSMGGTVRTHPREEITDRLFLAMANEAAWCLAEEVVPSPGLLDLSLILGIGFPPFRGGVCRWIDERGAAWAAGRLGELASTAGRRFAPSPLLQHAAQAGTRISAGPA